MTDTATEVLHDRQKVFADTFDDSILACHVGPRLTCDEVNALTGLLGALGRHNGSRFWLSAHQDECDECSPH
ncbi:hypothetical protein [Actinopolyspora halophila]|uniref:hypothetical protein n=1 Tax=Actinopolyspora halophila TaxID=1850 RepID=UPI000374B0EA|nr:hypothetical protein [Actinopolyspora halophila]